jgi:hypothetical protein
VPDDDEERNDNCCVRSHIWDVPAGLRVVFRRLVSQILFGYHSSLLQVNRRTSATSTAPVDETLRWTRFFVDGGRTAGVDRRKLYANSVYAFTVDVLTAYLDTRGSASYPKSTGSAHP